jgi:Domain of unknown function (DUF4442)
MNPSAPEFLKLVNHPFKFRIFLLTQLPSAYFSGVRVNEFDEQHCVASVPYRWFSKNPFKSTYFACLAMAAELTTGLLVQLNIYKRQPAVSMLVVGLRAEYSRKATSITYFTCDEGLRLRDAVDQAVASGEAVTFEALSIGRSSEGEEIARFYISWSLKVKNRL